MTQTQDVAIRPAAEVQRAEHQVVLTPPVDIYEDADGITLIADIPGVSKDRLNIEVDKRTLLIEGDAHLEMPEGIQALYADIRSTRYRRSFSLSPELEPNNIDASLKDGVLTLRIPKRAELRPRKIEVRVD
ncbi:Hsp20/alpha crystallin family protein [Methylocaldum szegediense]|uniref:HSP20 family protein n=1 Tax=Methylocaldum szegediense TaxID=73780 RepID=A0ABM9I667_9GAMM|nr:Hsp20/alpha crystallin family protein [Methylocaldum szegediense]CAI8917434.1 HSP20 family protein [Methylocaldum szegediense]